MSPSRHTGPDARRSVPLGSILRRHTLVTALIPLVVVELSLLALYFVYGREVVGQWRHEMATGLQQALQEVADTRARQLALTLTDIARTTDQVRTQAGQMLRGEVQPGEGFRPELYAVGRGGALYQRVNDGGASIFYSASTPIGEAEQRKIAATEPLDPLLERAVTNDPHVVAAYLNTHDDFNRYYPFISNAAEQFPPDLQMEEFAFYYAADAEHDPQREVVWTEAYLDPAGQGWMVSAVAPVYRDDFLEGVVGLDVTIADIAEHVLDLELPYPAPALLLTPDGSLLGLNRAAAERFSAGAAILDHAPRTIEDDERTLDAETPVARLLDDPGAAQHLLDRVKGDANSNGDLAELEIGGKPFFLAHAAMEQPPWRLVVLVNKHDVMAPVEAIESQSRSLALVVIGGMALFYALFFHVIYRRSRRLTQRVLAPLGALTEATNESGASLLPPVSHITEIDQLRDGFEQMFEANRIYQENIEELNEVLEAEIKEEVRKNREKDHLLLEQSRLASLGEMVASIAHQWRQPLTSLSLLLDDLQMRGEEGETTIEFADLQEYLADAQQLIEHMSTTVNDFRSIYRESPEPQTTRLRTIVDQALSLADGTLKAAGITVDVDDEKPDALLLARPNELCHVLLNLISNAQAVLTERRVADPRVTIRLRAEPSEQVIEIEDNGGGIDPAIAPRLFEPFATSRPDGTGLGLYMSRRLVVERFEGRLELRDGAHGACFRIELPSPPPSPSPSAEPGLRSGEKNHP